MDDKPELIEQTHPPLDPSATADAARPATDSPGRARPELRDSDFPVAAAARNRGAARGFVLAIALGLILWIMVIAIFAKML